MEDHGMARKHMEKHINAAALDVRSCRLLGVEPGTPAVLIRSFTKDMDEEYIEYCESFYPANRNDFILKIHL